MKEIIYVVLSLIPVVCPLSLYGSENTDFDLIIERCSGKSLGEITREGYKSIEREEYDKSLALYAVAISRNPDVLSGDEMREYIKALNNIGYIYLFRRNNPEKAYPYFLKARHMAETTNEYDLLGAILDNIAKVHDDFGDTEKAIELYNLAMDNAVKSDTKVSDVIQLMVLNDMVNCAMANDMVEKIGPGLEKFNTLPEYPIPMGKYSRMMSHALQMLLKNDNSEATAIIKNAEQYIDDRVDRARYVTDHNLTLANLYHIRHMEDSARIYLDRALKNSIDNKQIDRLPRIYRGMAVVESALGDSLEASRMKLMAYEIEEQLYSTKMYAYLNTLEATQKIDFLNIRLMEADIRHSHRVAIIWILVVAMAIIVSLSVVIFTRNRYLSESMRQLVSRHQASISREEAATRMRHEYEKTISRLQYELERYVRREDEPEAGSENESTTREQKRMVLPVDDKERLRIIGEVNDIFSKSDGIYDPHFSLEHLAELVDTKPRYLSALLNDTIGKSFNIMLAEARVKKACSLLLSPDFQKTKTIESIAAEVGYRSRTSFTSVFKKITGVTPLQYLSKAT